MNRPQEYSGEIKRSYDDLQGWRSLSDAVGIEISDVIGGYTSTTTGFNKSWSNQSPLDLLTDLGGQTATSAAVGAGALLAGFAAYISGLTLQIDIGTAYVPGRLGQDMVTALPSNSLINTGTATGYGDIAAGVSIYPLQCVSAPNTVTVVAPGAGNFRAYLVEVIPQQIDTTLSVDPNFQASGGTIPDMAVLPYYNSANPSQPLAGPGGLATPVSQPSTRLATCTVQFSANSPQTSASSMTAAIAALVLDTGAIPMYVIGISGTQAAIPATQNSVGGAGVAGGVWACGLGSAPPITGSFHAPFLRGFTQQHHLGAFGSAPQIDGSVEWKPLGPVPNNQQGFTNFSYLGSRQASNPTVTGGSTGPLANGGGVGVAGTDTSGVLSVTFGNPATAWPTGLTTICTFVPQNGLSVLTMVLQAWNLTAAAGGNYSTGSAAGLLLTWSISGTTVTISMLNTTGGTVTTTANATWRISYLATY